MTVGRGVGGWGWCEVMVGRGVGGWGWCEVMVRRGHGFPLTVVQSV